MTETKTLSFPNCSPNVKFDRKRMIILCFGLLFSALCLPADDFAQNNFQMTVAPPPARTLSKDEKNTLDGETDVKKRTTLALTMMDLRVKRAEECDSRNDFPQMYSELGGFHALMDYTLKFLVQSDGKKTLGSFKRYEMGLRGFPTRIELLRRELPVQYESYLRQLLKNIDDVRDKAIEPFFSDTVIPNN